MTCKNVVEFNVTLHGQPDPTLPNHNPRPTNDPIMLQRGTFVILQDTNEQRRLPFQKRIRAENSQKYEMFFCVDCPKNVKHVLTNTASLKPDTPILCGVLNDPVTITPDSKAYTTIAFAYRYTCDLFHLSIQKPFFNSLQEGDCIIPRIGGHLLIFAHKHKGLTPYSKTTINQFTPIHFNIILGEPPRTHDSNYVRVSIKQLYGTTEI